MYAPYAFEYNAEKQRVVLHYRNAPDRVLSVGDIKRRIGEKAVATASTDTAGIAAKTKAYTEHVRKQIKDSDMSDAAKKTELKILSSARWKTHAEHVVLDGIRKEAIEKDIDAMQKKVFTFDMLAIQKVVTDYGG